ncbi:MAG: type II toxin-antitoxin system RelE/ParE family toxin [Bacteroidetes bacterium]|nr:type II toxin-antitoxin system RelE/ParE family toxin [Bacteroidota bacterium]
MPKQIIWSPLSEKDFSYILEYLSKNWDNQVASKFIEITDHLINQISINPKQFPVIQKKKKVRKCVITKHNTLYYRERKAYVDILRIFDNRQDTRKLKFY